MRWRALYLHSPLGLAPIGTRGLRHRKCPSQSPSYSSRDQEVAERTVTETVTASVVRCVAHLKAWVFSWSKLLFLVQSPFPCPSSHCPHSILNSAASPSPRERERERERDLLGNNFHAGGVQSPIRSLVPFVLSHCFLFLWHSDSAYSMRILLIQCASC